MKTRNRGVFAVVIISAILLVFGIIKLSKYLDYQLVEQPRHVYCELIIPGLTQKEVESALSTIGSYESRLQTDPPPPRVYIDFHDPLTRIGIDTIILVYENDLLITVGRQSSLGDPGKLPECE